MAASESSSQIFRAMQRIAAQEPGWKKVIPSLGAAQPIKGRTGEAANLLPGAAAAGGGTAAPSLTYTETNYAARTYWPDRTFKSTDGLITFVEAPIKESFWLDGASNTVKFTAAQPA